MSVLVYGSGVAALSAARTLLQRGIATTLVSPLTAGALPGPAEGGISDGSDAEALVRDTLAAGDHENDRAAVEALAGAAAGWIAELRAIGVPLSHDRRRLPGHLSAGAVFVETITAPQIARALDGEVMRLSRQTSFARVEQLVAHEICVRDGRAVGLVGIDRITLAPRGFAADAIILAPSASSAPFGDPILDVALDAGARLRRGAFRLSPSVLWGASIPLSSSLVAEGARHWLPKDPDDVRPPRDIPSRERRFVLERRFPGYGSFAPADLAAQALHRALDKRGVYDRKHKRRRAACHLDVTHLPAGHLAPLVGRELAACRARTGVDPYALPLWVAPGVIGSLSGLDVDAQHRTSVAGLFAAGAAAARYHGRCPLDGNVLLADLHGGRVAAEACSGDGGAEPDAEALSRAADAVAAARAAEGAHDPAQARALLGEVAASLAFAGDRAGAAEQLAALRDAGLRCGDGVARGNRRALAILSLLRQLALAEIALSCPTADEGDVRHITLVRRDGDGIARTQRRITDRAGPRMFVEATDG